MDSRIQVLRTDFLHGDMEGVSDGPCATLRCGPENRLAYHLASRLMHDSGVTAEPWTIPSAIVVHGPHGSGKTTYLQVLHQILQNRSAKASVSFPDLLEWASQVTPRHGSKRGTKVRESTQPDVLVLDDVHRLADRTAAQRALFDRLESGRAPLGLIVSSLAPPWSSPLQARLISRLCAGLVVKLSLPGLEARKAWIEDLAQQMGLRLSPDAVRWMGHALPLGDAPLRRVLAACLSWVKESGSCSLADVKRATVACSLDGVVPSKSIMTAVCREFAVSTKELVGASRRRTIVLARAVAIHLLRNLTDFSLDSIGKVLGNRDHSTILNAMRRLELEMAQDASLRTRVTSLLQSIQEQPIALADRSRAGINQKPGRSRG